MGGRGWRPHQIPPFDSRDVWPSVYSIRNPWLVMMLVVEWGGDSATLQSFRIRGSQSRIAGYWGLDTLVTLLSTSHISPHRVYNCEPEIVINIS